MVALTYRMNNGVPGEVTRPSQSTIESQAFNSSLPFPQYGLPGKVASGLFVPVAATGDLALVTGILVRPFPTQGVNASDALGAAVPATSGICNVLRRGYITVKNNAGTPAKGGAVYVRFQNPSGAQIVGGIEATSTADTTALPNAKFTDAADANGFVEIEYNI